MHLKTRIHSSEGRLGPAKLLPELEPELLPEFSQQLEAELQPLEERLWPPVLLAALSMRDCREAGECIRIGVSRSVTAEAHPPRRAAYAYL